MNKFLATMGICLLLLSIALISPGCKSDSTTGPGAGTTITVSGKVIGTNNQPVAGVPVVIAGIASVNTDASGNFSIAGVTAPYTVTVIDGANKAAIVYRGLSRSDPTLVFFNSTPGVSRTASITGTIRPATSYPEPAGRKTLVAFASTETGKTVTATGATGAYALNNLTWYGPTTTTGALYALQFDYNTTTGLPTTYLGYGTRSGIALLDATSNPNGNDTMSAVSSAQVSGTVTAPAGYTIGGKSLGLRLGDKGLLSLLSESNPAAAFTYNTPTVSGATFTIMASASKSGASSIAYKVGVAGNATGVSVNIPNAPDQSLPINAATNITTGSLFSWSPFTGGIHLVIFQSGGKPSYYVITASASDSIPNLGSAGLGLPVASTYSWAVYGFGPFANVDAATGPAGFLGPLVGLPTGDGSYALAGTRTFTTAP
jgi:hypothetical protein